MRALTRGDLFAVTLTFDIVPCDGREVRSTVVDGAVTVHAPADVPVRDLADELSAVLTLAVATPPAERFDPMTVEVVATEQDEPHEMETCWLGSRLLVFVSAAQRLDAVARRMSQAMTACLGSGGAASNFAAGALTFALLPQLVDALT